MSQTNPMALPAVTLKRNAPRVRLTPEEATKWKTTVTALLWHCTAFSSIFYKMLSKNSGSDEYEAVFTEVVPVAATDGSAIAFNPKTFFKYDHHQRLFIFCHEIIHAMLDHPGLMRMWKAAGVIQYEDGTSLPFNLDLMNFCLDFIVNDILVEGGNGTLPPGALHNTAIATYADLAIDVYRKLYKPSRGGGGGNNGKDGTGGGDQVSGRFPGQQPFDVVLPPGTLNDVPESEAATSRNPVEWQTAIQTAMEMARLKGDLPASLERLFAEMLEPHVPWREHIQGLLARRTSSGGYNWRKPDRQLIVRDIYAPGRSGFGCGLVVVACDTSGSIGPKELDMFFAELAGIFGELNPKLVRIMWCDAAVHRVDDCTEPDDLNRVRHDGAPGGGGTSFVPVFDRIEEMGETPDALVYLTDGYGTFPSEAPSYPVIWGTIALGPEGFPFGDVVEVPKQA